MSAKRWIDIRTATRAEMELAAAHHRNKILGLCQQLKTDIDSYNDNTNDGAPIVVVFDFTKDLEELELATVTA